MDKLDKCTLLYLYRLCNRRLEMIEREIEKLERWTDTMEPVQRWLYRLVGLRHERKKIAAFLLVLEEQLAILSMSNKVDFHE